MPTGVMQWLNPKTGEGRVVRGGRRYAVRIESVESKARHPGARVHFDIDHHSDGDVALNVVLREGTRSSPRQRRFGDMVGARARETKIETVGPDVDSARGGVMHPMAVAQHWADCMIAGRLDDAVRLYSPTAAYHAGGDVAVGPRAIRPELERSPVVRRGVEPDAVEGDGDSIRVSWSRLNPTSEAIETHLVVVRGEIVEQWTGEIHQATATAATEATVQVSTEGAVSSDEREYAVDKVWGVVSTVAEPVRQMNVRLEWLAAPGRELRARARATLDLDGDPIRAQVSAHTMDEAADLLAGRLAQRLRSRSSHRTALRRRGPSSGPGEWRHGDEPGHRLGASRRPSQTRSLVQRLSWSAAPSTVDEAVFDLEALDLEFLLFTDLASGHDAVVSRRSGGSYAVHFADEDRMPDPPATVTAVEVYVSPAPRLTVDEARQRLDAGGEAWVFFVDRTSGRGQVLYRRDDGHDGLVKLADPQLSPSPVDG